MWETIGIALAGTIVYLDTTAIAQLMICQPIIACPLWGLIVGRPEIGLFFGVGFQLLWLGNLPVGAAKFPEGNLGAFVATALAARIPPASSGDPAWIVLTIATFIGIITAHFGAEVTPLVRRIMNGFAPRVIAAAQAGNSQRFRNIFAEAVAVHALAGFLFTALAFLIGKWIFALYLGHFALAGLNPALIDQTDALLSGLWPGLLGVGVAVLIGRFVKRENISWFGAAAAVGILAGWLWL